MVFFLMSYIFFYETVVYIQLNLTIVICLFQNLEEIGQIFFFILKKIYLFSTDTAFVKISNNG